jgi:hypothetical protein
MICTEMLTKEPEKLLLDGTTVAAHQRKQRAALWLAQKQSVPRTGTIDDFLGAGRIVESIFGFAMLLLPSTVVPSACQIDLLRGLFGSLQNLGPYSRK